MMSSIQHNNNTDDLVKIRLCSFISAGGTKYLIPLSRLEIFFEMLKSRDEGQNFLSKNYFVYTERIFNRDEFEALMRTLIKLGLVLNRGRGRSGSLSCDPLEALKILTQYTEIEGAGHENRV